MITKKDFTTLFRDARWKKGFRILGYILTIGIMGIFIVAIISGIIYLTTPKDSDITVILDDVQTLEFGMDDTNCIGEQDYPQPSVIFHVKGPAITGYSITAKEKPINITLGMQQGIVEMNLSIPDVKQPKSSQENVDETGKSIKVTATSLNATLGPQKEINLTEQICAYSIRYSPKLGSFFILNYNYHLPRSSFSSTNTVQSFSGKGQKVSLELKDVVWEGKSYDRIILTFTTGKDFPHSKFFISAEGENISVALPNGVFFDDQAQVSLEQTAVNKIVASQPIGNVSLEHDGVFSLEPAITYMESLDLVLGGDPDDFTKVFRNDYIYAFQEGEKYQIGGLSNNVIWRNQQKVKSPWQSLPIELQVLLLTTVLGLGGWIFRELIIRNKRFSTTLKGRNIQKEIPMGFTVFSLTSGQMIAGQLTKKPNKNNRFYILSAALIREKEGWVAFTTTEVKIDSSKIDFIYIQE